MDELTEGQTNNGGFRMIKKGRPLFKEVVQQIENGIVTGTLQAGEMLPPERILAEEFGVSRTVIREAMKSGDRRTIGDRQLRLLKAGQEIPVTLQQCNKLLEKYKDGS